MKKEVLDYVIEKTHELMNAASCSSEAKAAAQSWLDAVGTEREADETKEYIAEFKKGMKKNIMDNLYIMDKDGNKVKVEPKKKKR